MKDAMQRIYDHGIVPVIALEDAASAVPLARALEAGGLPVAEVTFRTAAAEESIRRMAAECPGVLVGAGTVLNVEQAGRAVKAGAKFIVSPGFSTAVVKFCQEQNVPITPGVITPTEITSALDMGVEILKFFPADAFGGIKTIKALSAPFGRARFIPTGGVNAANLAEFILFPKTWAVGGTWMVKADLVKAGKFEEITKLTREAVDTMLGFDLGHIGMNAPDADASLGVTRRLGAIFNLPVKEGNSSNFAGKGFEVNKSKGFGAHGHLAVATNSIARAMAYLERNGVSINAGSAKKDPAGNLVAVYLKDEVNGYAIHLLQKK